MRNTQKRSTREERVYASVEYSDYGSDVRAMRVFVDGYIQQPTVRSTMNYSIVIVKL